ncbi:MAG: hypothetical protein OHK0015_30070 [Chloroflexi bacterium OHK40]
MARILVVDDERAITDFVADALSDEGYTVTVCHDGASALLEVHREAPDVVLLDIGLPVMSGDLVLRQLRADGFTTLPIIVASAGTHLDQFLALGATAILRKPFGLERLIDLVAVYTSGEQAQGLERSIVQPPLPSSTGD